MSTPSRGSLSSGRGSGRRGRGTQCAVTQTPYQTRSRGTTRGAPQREQASRGHQSKSTSTPVGDQHPLPLSPEDLAKIAELVVRQLPTSSNAAPTAAAALVPPASSPAVTVVQSSLTTPPIVTRTVESVSVTGAHQAQVAVSGTSTQATPDERQSPLDVPCKLLIRGYVHVY